MPPISATIIARNEAASIARAIRSLSCADEIVVVDAESSDDTRKIAAELGARVIVRSWDGFSTQKNYAAEKARHDWILSLDADEELNTDAQAAVANWKRSEPRAAGYRFARRAFYLGRWILHSGWYPDFKLRLFDRRRGRWAGDFVHESVVTRGPVETLPGEILHYTCDSLRQHRERIEFYTDLAAQEMLARGEHAGWLRRGLGPSWTFFSTYFFRLGVLDGPQGFLIAWMAARYVRRKYSKYYHLRKTALSPHTTKDVIRGPQS
ncbi:MAG: glycosyltransferase family 2 protein [Acidobacteriia bacterium]|nr:glycosyltransferase family 2 protein [Terriglobia bacterium]